MIQKKEANGAETLLFKWCIGETIGRLSIAWCRIAGGGRMISISSSDVSPSLGSS